MNCGEQPSVRFKGQRADIDDVAIAGQCVSGRRLRGDLRCGGRTDLAEPIGKARASDHS